MSHEDIGRSGNGIALVGAERRCDDWPAWIAGFLAPIGWLATIAANAGEISDRPDLSRNNNTSWQRDAWGYDHTAIARRMCRAWRLPTWLSAIVGNLGLPASIAE